MMTGMARLQAALAGEPADRIPVFCNLLDQGASELGLPPEAYYANGEQVAEAQLRMRAKYGYDNLWALFYVGREAELLGCQKVRFSPDGPPNVEDFVIKSYDDIATLEIPEDLTAHPAFEEPLKCLKVLRQEAGGKYPICGYFSSSMTLPSLLMGMDRWFELLFMGPADLRDELLRKCHAFFVKEVAAYRAHGVDVVLYSNPFGSLEVVPPRFFAEHSLPWIEHDLASIGPAGVVYYCGTARMNPVVAQVRERTGIGVYYLSPHDDIAAGKQLLGGHALTCGIINDVGLIDASLDAVREEVRRILAAGMPGGRFLFGTGVMPMGIPESTIRAMLETAYMLGANPQGAIHE